VADDLSSKDVPGERADDHADGVGALTIIYADFTCPHCAVTFLRLREAPGRLVFRHFALKTRHPRSVALACAAQAAGLQGAFWPFAESLYTDQGHLDDPHLWARCEQLGLDVDRFEDDRRGADCAERVRRDTREGLRAGIVGTPAVFVLPGARTC